MLAIVFKIYRYSVAPALMALGVRCRFTPSCSHYTEEAIKRFGFFYGAYLGALRLGRCHPWCEGGNDPVPTMKEGKNG